MKTILVVNAGSSSLKFQVFALGTLPDRNCLVKGQIGGIGTRPRLRAQAADKRPLIDQTYTPDQVIDLPAAMHAAELAVCFALPLDQKNSIAKGASGVDVRWASVIARPPTPAF